MIIDHPLIRDGSDEACGCEAYCSGPKEYRCDFEHYFFSTVYLHIQRYLHTCITCFTCLTCITCITCCFAQLQEQLLLALERRGGTEV